MSYINMKNSINLNFLPVSSAFIDRYITKAKAVFVCIYIYSLKKCMEGQKITLKSTADEFDILESDVLNAWKFWKKEGVVDFDEKEDGFLIEFFDISPSDLKLDKNGADDNKFDMLVSINDKKTDKKRFINKEAIPDYSIEELNVYGEDENVGRLYKTAEKAFSSMLDYRKMKLVFSLYDWLGMSVELIEFLIKYCVSEGKGRNLRYIETVAIDWNERGIDSVEKAEEMVRVFNNEYKEIMKELGVSIILPAEGQIKFMEDWIKKLPIDVIKEACRRTVLKTGKPAFEYADSIIQKWYNHGVKNFSDIEKIDIEFNKNKKDIKKAENKKTSKTNNFVNYEQRKWDFDTLNRLKGELLDKNLKE